MSKRGPCHGNKQRTADKEPFDTYFGTGNAKER